MSTPYRSSGDTVWERPEPHRRSSVRDLTRTELVETAVALADRDGLAEASVRKVAAELGVGPMRFYRFVGTTDELHELMVDAFYAEVLAGAPTPGDVRALLLRTRGVLLEHEWVVELLGHRPHLGPHGLAWLEALAAALDRPGDQAWVAMGVLNGYLVGALRREVADRRAARAGDGLDSWQQRAAPYVSRMLETGRYPALRSLIVDAERPEGEAAFEAELAVVLRGLA